MKPKPDDEDIALFREATRDVKPLTAAPRAPAGASRPRARARFARSQHLQLPEAIPYGGPDEPGLSPGDVSCFARPGLAAARLGKLRRGQYRIEAQLDLHGLRSAEAHLLLHEFLRDCLQRHVRCVRIVHGKGLRSGPHGPVLRQMVNHTLRGTARVPAFVSAPQRDGGTGALYVLLDTAQASSASTTEA